MYFHEQSLKERLIVFIVIIILGIPGAGFADLYPAQFQIPGISKAPTLDGKLQKGEWDQCQEIFDFIYWTLDRYEDDPVTAYLGFDQENLYVAFLSVFTDPEMWEKTYEEKQPIDSHLWGRNNVRIQLGNDDVSIHLMAAPSLSRADFKNGDMSWNGNWDFATSVNEDHWIAEIKIPFSDLDLDQPPIDEMWSLTLGRTHPAAARTSLWHGKVRFVKSVSIYPAIKMWPQHFPGSNQQEFILKNTGKEAKTVNCEIELIPFEGKPEFINQTGQGSSTQFILPLTKAPVRYNRNVNISAGETKTTAVTCELHDEGSYYATATCYSEDGSILMRNRGYWFSLTPNRKRLRGLTKKANEGIAICRKISAPVAEELNSMGHLIVEDLNTLTADADNMWEANTWSDFSEQVNRQEIRVYQYINRVRCASLFNWERNPEFGVTVTHSIKKIRRDDFYDEVITNHANISVAKNEYESFQVVILPFGEDIKGITLSPTDLICPEGNIIPKSMIKISLVDYNLINMQPSYVIEAEGWYPDPLIPVDAPVDINGSEISRPFWITVYVPPGMPAGVYKGSINIQADGSEGHSISIDLKVWDFEIPTESHLKTHTWDDIDMFNEFYNVEEIPVDWYLNFCEVLLKNRLSPGFAGVNYLDQKPDKKGKCDFSRVEKVLEFCLERGLTRYSLIQMRKGFYTPEEKEEIYRFIHEYTGFLRKKGWLDRGLVEVWDEPTIVRLPAVIQRAKDLREMDPDLRLQLFAFGHKEFDFWKPEAKKYGLVDLIDIWAPWPLIESPESQAEGREIWSYFCTLARSNAPNFYIESPAVYQRTIAWHSWMFGVDAFEHWSTNYFWRNTHAGKPMNEKWPYRRWDSRTYMDYHGEGQLVYPGSDGTCIPSMRLEIFRDGMDDYEYLYRLRELIEKCEKENIELDLNPYRQLLKVEEYLLIKYPENFTFTQENTIRYPDQPEKFMESRRQLAEAIEILQNIHEK